uniref:Uncharacterized protein n=1 Tax=Euplotes harpa TaxID=151035 RepID=A0A7S3JHI7_9SPIT|mmetsp:Transcript_40796/g.46771  ORF Transcript_40796/g.46771 Transcript_40796/m.46771 type:complete len:264 (+) Transcript_40796:827-1618(+)
MMLEEEEDAQAREIVQNRLKVQSVSGLRLNVEAETSVADAAIDTAQTVSQGAQSVASTVTDAATKVENSAAGTAAAVKDATVDVANKSTQVASDAYASVFGSNYTNASTVTNTGTNPQMPSMNQKSTAEILAEPTQAVAECNLTCFSECLNLKKYVPFPVIQQCITYRCHCDIDGGADTMEEIIDLLGVDAATNAPQVSQKSTFASLIFALVIMGALATGAYYLYKYYEDFSQLKKCTRFSKTLPYSSLQGEDLTENEGYRKL